MAWLLYQCAKLFKCWENDIILRRNRPFHVDEAFPMCTRFEFWSEKKSYNFSLVRHNQLELAVELDGCGPDGCCMTPLT